MVRSLGNYLQLKLWLKISPKCPFLGAGFSFCWTLIVIILDSLLWIICSCNFCLKFRQNVRFLASRIVGFYFLIQPQTIQRFYQWHICCFTFYPSNQNSEINLGLALTVLKSLPLSFHMQVRLGMATRPGCNYPHCLLWLF